MFRKEVKTGHDILIASKTEHVLGICSENNKKLNMKCILYQKMDVYLQRVQ